jgi:hypothetical protein
MNVTQVTTQAPKSVVPSFAGLGEVFRQGLNVHDAVARLLRLAYVEKRLMFLCASHMVTEPQRDRKLLLGRLQFLAGERSNRLQERLRQLRTPKVRIEGVPDTSLEILMDEALHVRTGDELWLVLCGLHLELRIAYEKYLKDTNPLADSPTCDLLASFLPRLSQSAGWLGEQGEPVSASLGGTWLESYLETSGGLDGARPQTGAQAERERSLNPFHIPRTPGRDASVAQVWDYVKPELSDTAHYLVYMMGIRLSEINVAEGLALVLCETPDMPWEFYHDLSRHLWDEVRHSMMGQAAIESTYGTGPVIPMRDYESAYCMESTPFEQYATLGLEIEGAQMKYPVGKRGEWEFCRDAAKHSLMTTFQDFDWADEVLHVNIAKRRLTEWFPRGTADLNVLAEQGKLNRAQVKQRHPAVVVEVPKPVDK